MFQLWINANVTDAMRAQMGKDGQWKHESVPPPLQHPFGVIAAAKLLQVTFVSGP